MKDKDKAGMLFQNLEVGDKRGMRRVRLLETERWEIRDLRNSDNLYATSGCHLNITLIMVDTT